MRKKYSKNDSLFILNETLKHKTLTQAFIAIAPVFKVTSDAIRNQYYTLKKEYPEHPTYTKVWLKGHKQSKPMKWYKKLFNRLFK